MHQGFYKAIYAWACILLVLWAATSSNATSQNRTHLTLKYAAPLEQADLIRHNASEVLTALNKAYFEKQEPVFNDDTISQEGRNYIRALWNSAPFYCPDTEVSTALIHRPHGEGFEVRGVRLFVKAKANQSQEEGILLFSKDGRVDQIRFGVEEHLYQYVIDVNAEGAEFIHRQIILDFVEKYRTAYNLKDLPFIRNVLSENALIIIGKVVEVEQTYELDQILEEKTIELVRLGRDDYLNRLQAVFEKNEFIDVGYDSLEVYQHPQFPDIYGVTLLQHWNSSSYSDKGYLFLMIDFRDIRKPIIHVRTWQLMEYTRRDEVLGLGDFPIF